MKIKLTRGHKDHFDYGRDNERTVNYVELSFGNDFEVGFSVSVRKYSKSITLRVELGDSVFTVKEPKDTFDMGMWFERICELYSLLYSDRQERAIMKYYDVLMEM